MQWYDKAELREAVRLYDTAPERPLHVLQQVRACKGGMQFLLFHTLCSCMVAQEGWHQPCASLHALSSDDDSLMRYRLLIQAPCTKVDLELSTNSNVFNLPVFCCLAAGEHGRAWLLGAAARGNCAPPHPLVGAARWTVFPLCQDPAPAQAVTLITQFSVSPCIRATCIRVAAASLSRPSACACCDTALYNFSVGAGIRATVPSIRSSPCRGCDTGSPISAWPLWPGSLLCPFEQERASTQAVTPMPTLSVGLCMTA